MEKKKRTKRERKPEVSNVEKAIRILQDNGMVSLVVMFDDGSKNFIWTDFSRHIDLLTSCESRLHALKDTLKDKYMADFDGLYNVKKNESQKDKIVKSYMG